MTTREECQGVAQNWMGLTTGSKLSGRMALVALFLLLYIALLGVRPLIIPDETRYGEIPREMLTSGDWVVPHLDGIRYFEKPVLGYWLNALSMQVFGENAFAIRLPSALAVGLTAALLFLWARRFSEDETTPLFTTAVFLLSIEVWAIGTFCVLDSLLSLFVTAAIIALYFALQQTGSGRRMLFFALAGTACGLAFLTKGFLALAIPVLAMVPFSLWQRQFRILLRNGWITLASAVLVALPWAILIHRREPDFWHYFFWIEHVDRFLSPRGGQHPEPFWYYVPVLLGGAMPWTPLLGPIVAGLRHTGRRDPMVRLALCWFVVPFVFFSISSGKLGTYILPCYPPMAFLVAVGVLRCLREGDTKGFITGARVVLLAIGLCFVALLVGLIIMPQRVLSIELWKWAIAVAGLVLWAMLCWSAIRHEEMCKRLLLYCTGPVLLILALPLVMPVALTARKMPGALLVSNAARITPDTVLVTEDGLAASVCWYYGRDDVYILGGVGEYEYGLSYTDSKHRNINVRQLADKIAEQGERGRIVLITDARGRAKRENKLPDPSYETHDDGLFWIEYASMSGPVELKERPPE